jgi:hypothetical protein
MSGDAQLLLVIAGVHLFGFAAIAVLMIPALREGWGSPPGASGSDSDDGGGRGPERPPQMPPSSPSGGLPLPDAVPARVRLRDHGRLGDYLPARERRPAREPAREPERTPV